MPRAIRPVVGTERHAALRAVLLLTQSMLATCQGEAARPHCWPPPEEYHHRFLKCPARACIRQARGFFPAERRGDPILRRMLAKDAEARREALLAGQAPQRGSPRVGPQMPACWGRCSPTSPGGPSRLARFDGLVGVGWGRSTQRLTRSASEPRLALETRARSSNVVFKRQPQTRAPRCLAQVQRPAQSCPSARAVAVSPGDA